MDKIDVPHGVVLSFIVWQLFVLFIGSWIMTARK